MAALLAREAVALDGSPQTEGTLLSTLLRSPAVLGTFSLPTNSTPHVAISPDGAHGSRVGHRGRQRALLQRAHARA